MTVANAARLLGGLVLSVTLVSSAAALDEQRVSKFFALMDGDDNGSISRPEFQRGKGAVFLAIDADGSMSITRNETRLTEDAFKMLAGGDDAIDGEEFIAADAASFEAIDKNQDHAISPRELFDYVAQYSN